MKKALHIMLKAPDDTHSMSYVGNCVMVSEHPETGHESYISFLCSGVLRTFPLSWVVKIEIWE